METIVISVGGSLLVPESIDTEFISRFRDFIQSMRDTRFILVTGGGAVCRRYQDTARALGVTEQESLDWIGIMITRVNAELLRAALGSSTEVQYDPHKRATGNKVIIAAGHLPGSSTDYDAVILAQTYKATLLINLFNQDYVYDKDPRLHPDARPLPVLSWKDYLAMIGPTWNPGLHAPFDPIAAMEAQKSGLRVILANGANLENVAHIISRESFIGTVLE
ncbi:UMP kinase [Candidatus Woesearchaeota archaeon]|nr:UMP kinase [Candidatus Woesearchaeota archaeon]